MCGIATILKFDGDPVEVSDLRRMSSAIAHRGPDGAGYAVLNRGSVGLGHVRLSIVDLTGGDQPIFNEDQTVAVVANGEIYDHRELREELLELGHTFRTTSDSEVLLHLYEEHGPDFVERLNGEFAFVIWDNARRRLLAGRDRLGVKPLYFLKTPRELLLCSEAKGILALPRVDRRFSLTYLTGPALGVYPRAASVFANVNCVKPGHVLLADANGSFEQREYFRPRFRVDSRMSFEAAAWSVRERLTTAVRRRLDADVPVHAYLSGGLDSTIVCGLMSQLGAEFTAFNVGFPDSPYDESLKARRVANFFGQSFETIPCSHESLAANIQRTVYCTEMPLHNYNSVAKLLLSKFVRSHGQKVCLTGEGSDELFAGYPYFKLEALWRMLLADDSRSSPATKLLAQFREMETRSEGLLWDRTDRWRKATHLFGFPSHFHARARQAGRCVKLLFAKSLGLTSGHRPVSQLQQAFDWDEVQSLHPLNATRLATFNQLYGQVIPSLGDRVEMANSVECRTPFLDRDVVDLALAIPPDYFLDVQQLREKHLLRHAFRDLLPPQFHQEHKHPFLAPTWLTFAGTRSGRAIFRDFLSLQTTREAGVFRPAAVAVLRGLAKWAPLRRGLSRQVDALLGMVLSVHMLHRQFIAAPPPSDPHFAMQNRTPRSAAVGVTAALANA